MIGVCGTDYRGVLDRSLGPNVFEDVLREAEFFFRDEIPACMAWQFGPADFARVTSPVLVIEGAKGRHTGVLSRQVTERAASLFARAETALIENTNHMLPLQDAQGLGRAVADFARRHVINPDRI
jgi:pimeloyl-ACP methyl ester carboxylesterase